MGRRLVLKVKQNPELFCGRLYPVVIDSTDMVKGQLEVTLHHLSDQQDGRKQVVYLPGEVYPESRTASLFRACGFGTAVDTELEPKHLEGKAVKVRFRRDDRGETVVDQFESCCGEVTHEAGNQF